MEGNAAESKTSSFDLGSGSSNVLIRTINLMRLYDLKEQRHLWVPKFAHVLSKSDVAIELLLDVIPGGSATYKYRSVSSFVTMYNSR